MVCPRVCRSPTPDPAPPPPVKWAQRADVVLVSIPLRDITEEQLSVSDRRLSIRWEGQGGEGMIGLAMLVSHTEACCLPCHALVWSV